MNDDPNDTPITLPPATEEGLAAFLEPCENDLQRETSALVFACVHLLRAIEGLKA